jgi:hypothetical protein
MKTLIYILILISFCSCNNTNRKNKVIAEKYFSLRVATNANLIEYLDYPEISSPIRDQIIYDSVSHKTISIFNGVRSGPISVSIFSLLTNSFKKIVDLQNDTVISFDSTLYSNFTTGNVKDLLSLPGSKADTFFIGQKMIGCFGGHAEKMVIIKVDQGYEISYSRNGSNFLNEKKIAADSLFNKHFRDYIFGFRKFLSNKSDTVNILLFSTTRYHTYIRNGNTIYQLPEIDYNEAYSEFKKNTGIKLTD